MTIYVALFMCWSDEGVDLLWSVDEVNVSQGDERGVRSRLGAFFFFFF
jgi:hypothetical protein